MLDSMMEFTKDQLSDILNEYVNNAVLLLKDDQKKYQQQAISVVSRRRLFGLRKPLAENPTPEQAVAIAKSKLKWYGYSNQSYLARRVQAHYFQNMMDKSDPESRILLSVDDFSMLMNGDYSSKASWNSNSWDKKTDPNLADY